MDAIKIYKIIKENFCELTSYKLRGEVLEVITAFSTLNNKFVSVFIKIETDKIIVTDNGWVDLNAYGVEINDENEEIQHRVIMNFANTYGIKAVDDSTGATFYYKTCQNYNNLSSIVFDVASFVVGAINAFCVNYIDAKETKERETFRKDANDFLSIKYKELVKFRQPLDDFKNIKFSALIAKSSEIYLITYISGSTTNYFDNDIRKTIVNFEMSLKSKYKDAIKERLSLVNNLSEGYNPTKSSSILGLLREKATRDPVNWSEKELIHDYIQL